jgi:hypothetical protein
VQTAPVPSNHTDVFAPTSLDTLQTFTLDDLAQYTREGAFGPTASPDFRVFYVGRDDVHGVLVHLYTRVRLSVKMNMFGYDDDQLNQILFGLVHDPNVMVQVTNWSASGEGTGIVLGDAKQNPGFKAQNNTLSVYVNPYEIAKFSARLDYEHGVAAHQSQPASAKS